MMNSSNNSSRRTRLLLAFALALTAGLATLSYAVMKRGSSSPFAKTPPPMNQESQSLYDKAGKLRHLHQPMGIVQPGDWLESHKEDGQTFQQYAGIEHIRLTKDRNVLYVLPLGDFDQQQNRIVELSAEFLGLYFGCDVKTLPAKGLDVIPDDARRVHPNWGMRQINSRFVLHKLLPPLLPDDAVALIAFSSSDLYPQDDWNFVYGQASLAHRVGVWSIYRNGDPATEFETVLRRTLKTASHETGHMFTIKHCTEFECNMCGANNRDESDRRPIWLCPECIAKVWRATNCDPEKRFEALKEYCQRNKLNKEAEFFRESLKALKE